MQASRGSADASARIAIDARSVHAVVRLPLDELDLLLRLDRDLDGQVSATELETARNAVGAYVTQHLHVNGDASPLTLSIGRVTLSAPAGTAAYVEAVAESRARSRMSTVSIDSRLLTDLSEASATKAEIRVGDRVETFVFEKGAVFERRLSPDWLTSAVLVAAAALVLGLLWFVRRRRAAAMAAAALLFAATVSADVIMSAPALNATLKTMEKLKRRAEGEPVRDRGEALFQLGAEADGLAALINLEVESHGMQERALIELALSRTKELGVAIAYNRDKKKFFYDGAAFSAYLSALPRGAHAAAAAFKLLSYQFYQLAPTDRRALASAVDATKRFLALHPSFAANAEVRLYLAVNYRDLHRAYASAGDETNASTYRRLARQESQRIVRLYPRTEQAGAARQLLSTLWSDH